MQFKPEWSISDLVNGVVAAGTLVMAIYTRKMIKKTQNSIEAAERSARATEESAERMKDGLMPHLALDISGATGGFSLYIRNVGSGLAKIRLATVRNDIHIDSVIDEPICYWEGKCDNPDLKKGYVRLIDFTLGAGDEFSFLLNSDKQLNRDPQYDWLSSLSVFYEDIYGRLYRSRLVYLHKSINGSFTIRSIGTENFAIEEIPLSPLTNNKIERFWGLEGGKLHVYRPHYRLFYLLKFVQQSTGRPVTGTAFTKNADLIIRDIIFPWHGCPEFHVQIGNLKPFALVAYPDSNTGQLKYNVRDIPDTSAWDTIAILQQKSPFSEYGLLAEGNDEPLISELYEKVCKTLGDVVEKMAVKQVLVSDLESIN